MAIPKTLISFIFLLTIGATMPTAPKEKLGTSTNPAQVLSRRAIPPDQRCDNANDWDGRYCDGNVSPVAWYDECTDEDGDIYSRYRDCPPNTVCMGTVDNDGHDNIHCIERPAGPSETSSDRQSGIYRVASGARGERIISVPLAKPIEDATVAAHLEGSGQNFVLAANKAIVGTIRGTKTKPCEYNAKQRECDPLGTHNLQKGAIIDFTFGVDDGQSGNLIYAILGRNPS